jgi:hypothetical protein
VPAPGEKVPADQATFEVLTVTGRRIRKVRALRRPHVEASENGDEPARGAAPVAEKDEDQDDGG